MSLSNKISFVRVLSRGKKSTDAFFFVAYLNNGHPIGRIGVSVPKRLVGRATERNKIKRAVKEAFLQTLRPLSVDIVAIYKDKPAQKRSVKIVRESIQKHFDRIKTELETRENQ